MDPRNARVQSIEESNANELQSPQSPAQYSAQYPESARYQYNPQSPGQFQASPMSPVAQYSPAHSPNPASPYLNNFMNLSPTHHPQPAYSPDARSAGGNTYEALYSCINMPPENSRSLNRADHRHIPTVPSSPLYQHPYPEQNTYARNDHAGVRVPNTGSGPIGPYGPGAAVSISDFAGYPQLAPHQRSPRISQDLPVRTRPNIELAVSPELGPGADPPPLTSQYINHSRNNNEKHTDANIEDRFEQFILSEGEKKCVVKADTRKHLPLLTLHLLDLLIIQQVHQTALSSRSPRKITHSATFSNVNS